MGVTWGRGFPTTPRTSAASLRLSHAAAFVLLRRKVPNPLLFRRLRTDSFGREFVFSNHVRFNSDEIGDYLSSLLLLGRSS